MAIPAIERFCIRDIKQELFLNQKGEIEPFDFSYTYEEKGKKKKKQIKLFSLGESLNKDLVENESEIQMICCNEDGDIFEFAINKEENKTLLIAIRSNKV